MKFTTSSCVLCGLGIAKNTDKNLVDGRRGNTFNVQGELLSLEYKVEIDSMYICRNCLSARKKRRALLTNLQEGNITIKKIVHSKKSSAFPLPVNVISTPSLNQLSYSQEQATKRVALENLRTSVHSVDSEEDGSGLPSSTSINGQAHLLQHHVRVIPKKHSSGWRTIFYLSYPKHHSPSVNTLYREGGRKSKERLSLKSSLQLKQGQKVRGFY